MLHRTPSSCCTRDIGVSKAHIPQLCEHGELLRYTKPPKRSKPAPKRKRRRESAAERKARERFSEAALARPCFFVGRRDCERCVGRGETILFGEEKWACTECNGSGQHRCSGPKDAHHLVEQQWLKRNYADRPADELLAIRFDPRIGAPLCRDNAHDPITRKATRIYWHELNPECIEFCTEVDDRYLELPTPWGGRRQSMVERLKLECSEREAVAS